MVTSPSDSAERELYFLDTEFVEDGQSVDLISIGVITLSGRALYRCNADAKLGRANDWVRANVLPHLPPDKDTTVWKKKAAIADELRAFVRAEPKPQFWGYYSDYDWVAVCQLFGTMMDLPKWFPKYCMDLKQLSVMLGSPKHPPQETGHHHALFDAQWNRDLYLALMATVAQSELSTDDAIALSVFTPNLASVIEREPPAKADETRAAARAELAGLLRELAYFRKLTR
jgi:3'-5' exoribonuclease Rv2179c-like domain